MLLKIGIHGIDGRRMRVDDIAGIMDISSERVYYNLNQERDVQKKCYVKLQQDGC